MKFDTPPDNSPEQEKITSAALLFRGKIYTGIHHAECYDAIKLDYPDLNDETFLAEGVDGFVTNTEKFVDRKEAWNIAKKSEQLSHLEESAEEKIDPEIRENPNEFDSTDLEFNDLLLERKQPGWENIFSQWEKEEQKNKDYEAFWRERGFSSWKEWREAYIAPLELASEMWNVGILENPTNTLRDFYGGPTYTWQQRAYEGAQILPFSEIVKKPFVQNREKIKHIQDHFPEETLLIAIEYQGKRIIIEGMHRTCALVMWPEDKPFTSTVRLAIAYITGRNPYGGQLPNIGNNYPSKND